MIWSFELNQLIVGQIFVNIFEGRRWRHWLENTETKTVSLVRLMIRILTHYNHLYFVDWGCLKSVKNVLFLGVNLL